MLRSWSSNQKTVVGVLAILFSSALIIFFFILLNEDEHEKADLGEPRPPVITTEVMLPDEEVKSLGENEQESDPIEINLKDRKTVTPGHTPVQRVPSNNSHNSGTPSNTSLNNPTSNYSNNRNNSSSSGRTSGTTATNDTTQSGTNNPPSDGSTSKPVENKEEKPVEISKVTIPATPSSLLKPKAFPRPTEIELEKMLNKAEAKDSKIDIKDIHKNIFLQNLRYLRETCKGNVWTLSPTDIAEILHIPEKDAGQYLKFEHDLQNFYWEMVKVGYVHKYLGSGTSEDEKATRDVLLNALKCTLPEELKTKIEAALSRLSNPFKKLISHLEGNPAVNHLSQLPSDLADLLKDALNVESIQSPPTLLSRLTVLYEEAQLKKRILVLLNSPVAEIIDADVNAAIRDHVHLGLSAVQVDELKKSL